MVSGVHWIGSQLIIRVTQEVRMFLGKVYSHDFEIPTSLVQE